MQSQGYCASFIGENCFEVAGVKAYSKNLEKLIQRANPES